MKRPNQAHLKLGLKTLGFMSLLIAVAYASDGPFAGKWKGELKSTPAARSSTTPGTDGSTSTGTSTSSSSSGASSSGASSRTGASSSGASSRTGASSSGASSSTGARRPGGGSSGGFGTGGGGVSQKVSLNLKQSKDDKVSGNITIGESNPDDVKEGRVVGNTISFKAGRPPQPIYEYYGELKEDELVLTRNLPGARGSAPQQVVLSKK
jgi:hypothetical protein